MAFLRCAITASLFLSPFVSAAAGIYGKDSAVLQVDYKSYDRLIARSNYTSMVEFYAPWCGHCQNLKPAYEKAATALKGYANVAAVNCDEDENKSFCGSMGIQGFPTLKLVKPAKVAGKRPAVEDYKGARTAKGINDAVLDKMPNHVKKLTDKSLGEWLTASNDSAKGILFSDKGAIGPLMKALAIDFLGSIPFAQIYKSESHSTKKFGITRYPSILLLPGGTEDAIVYDGDIKKAPLVEFFSQAAAPNSKAAAEDVPSKPKKAKSGKSKASSAAASCPVGSDKPSTAEKPAAKKPAAEEPAADKPAEDKPAAEKAAADKIDAQNPPAPAITVISKPESLQKTCLTTTSGTCILAFFPASLDVNAQSQTLADYPALINLAALVDKHKQRGSNLFPFYGIPASNSLGLDVQKSMELDTTTDPKRIHIVAVNAKKKWYVLCPDGKEKELESLQSWVDDLRFGEGDKRTLPASIEVTKGEKKEKKKKEPVKGAVTEESKDDDHDEL